MFIMGISSPCTLDHRLHPNHFQDPQPRQWVEFFAGKAEATRMFQESGARVAKLDIIYMRPNGDGMNPMDLLTDAGFAFLVVILNLSFAA